MTAFSNALYYPWIDVQDERWLKSALLLWESVQTIVPESIKNPYSSRTARAFQDAGLLRPLHVHSGMDLVNGLSEPAFEYFYTPEGQDILFEGVRRRPAQIHQEKAPSQMFERMRSYSMDIDMHSSKLPYLIARLAEESGAAFRRGDWLSVDEGFANYYMTLLATRLAERHALGLLADTPSVNRLADAARLGNALGMLGSPPFRTRRHVSAGTPVGGAHQMAAGLLANVALAQIWVSPATSVEKILKFRKQHAAEIGQFRCEISRLIGSIDKGAAVDQIREEVCSIYSNQVSPALRNLKASLDGLKIKWATEGFVKVAFLSLSSTAIPTALLGLSAPLALLGGAGISVAVSGARYNEDRKKLLADSPYSFLLALQNT